MIGPTPLLCFKDFHILMTGRDEVTIEASETLMV